MKKIFFFLSPKKDRFLVGKMRSFFDMVQKSVPRAYLGSFFDYGPCMGNLPHGLAEAWNVTSVVCVEYLPVFLF